MPVAPVTGLQLVPVYTCVVPGPVLLQQILVGYKYYRLLQEWGGH